MKVNLVIPAKGQSERVHNKNMRELRGVPLLVRAINKAHQLDFVDGVYVDTNVDHLAHVAERENANVIRRPDELATNDTDGNELLMWELDNMPPCDFVIQMICTAPFITIPTIEFGYLTTIRDRHIDSFFVGVGHWSLAWHNGYPLNFNPYEKLPNSDDLKPVLIDTTAVYGIYTRVAREVGARIGRQRYPVVVNQFEGFDINTPNDLLWATRLAQWLL